MVNGAVALLPVLLFLASLMLMDSFKLVSLRSVFRAILAGCATALGCALLNDALLQAVEPKAFSRYVAPVIEELAKSLYLVYLLRRDRIGFLVDAAIYGFAIGAGFALVENVDYLRAIGGAGLTLWIARGFGTALLHGAATSILAMLSKGFADRHARWGLAVVLPGLLAATLLHSVFNHFILPPLVAAAILLAVLPLAVIAVFQHSEKGTREWLGLGFDTDVELLRLIHSGAVGTTKVGAYLQSLRSRFPGLVVADMLCLLRIHLELSIRAKGLMLAQEAGIALPLGEDVKANLEELRYLEKSIGKTGLLALKPIQMLSRRDLWQLYRLRRAA